MRPCACQGRDSVEDPLLSKPARRKTITFPMPAPSPRIVHLWRSAAIAVSPFICRPHLASCASPGSLCYTPAAAEAAERRATIFYTGAVRGTLEPCGCTSDPLGDIARMATVVRQAGKSVAAAGRGQPALWRANLYPRRGRRAPTCRPPSWRPSWPSCRWRGSGWARPIWRAGPGGSCPAGWPPTPADGAAFVQPSSIRTVGGIKVGVLGVADPELLRRHGLKAGGSGGGSGRARRRGCASRAPRWWCCWRRWSARRPGGWRGAAGPTSSWWAPIPAWAWCGRIRSAAASWWRPRRSCRRSGGSIWCCADEPGKRPALVDAGGVEARELERAALRRRLEQLDAELAALVEQASGAADPALRRGRARRSAPSCPPSCESLAGAFVAAGHRIVLHQPADPAAAGAAPRSRGWRRPCASWTSRWARPTCARPRRRHRAGPDRAAFVGDASCAKCHKPAMAFWRTTVHAGAWKTIVDGGKTGIDRLRELPRHRLRRGGRLQPGAREAADRRAVRDLPRPGLAARRRPRGWRSRRRSGWRRPSPPASAATTRSTRTPSSTPPTCATCWGRATGPRRARSWAPAPPATSCDRRPSPPPRPPARRS